MFQWWIMFVATQHRCTWIWFVVWQLDCQLLSRFDQGSMRWCFVLQMQIQKIGCRAEN